MPPGATAIVVDRWPLVRLGLTGVLKTTGVEVVAEATKVGEALLQQRARGANLLVFGSPSDGLSASSIRSAKRDDPAPKVVALLAAATSAEVTALFSAGADALLVASSGPGELADAFRRVLRGERVVGPALGQALARREEAVAAPPEERAGPLTAKELEVLELLAKGLSNKQIQRVLMISEGTTKSHLTHIYEKLEVSGRHGALSRAAELGLLG